MTDLWQRLKQRKLVQWALAYAAAAFALLQGVDMVAAKFGWPNSVARYLILAAVVGFFVTLLLAWYHGERGAQKVSGTELALLAVLLAIGGGVIWKFGPADAAPVASGTAAPATASASASIPSATPAPATGPKSIAVLPFENLSADKDNAYFASGMQDMILTKLAAIGELKVISRTSTDKYASHPDDLKTIAQQLGVATVLEGSVQKSGNSVLINVQLIDAASDRHLWAEAYPRTLENVFGVEGEVAQKVADALRAKLSSAESASVASVPTQNPAAYESFLRAEYLAARADQTWDLPTYLAADAGFRKSLELDPSFALAYARLARSQLSRHWFGAPLTAPELEGVKAAIDRALALAPALPDAHLALAYYHYWGFRDYEAASVEFERTLALSPNQVDAILGLAYIARRTSHIPDSVTWFDRALVLSPRDARQLTESGWSYVLLRRYAEADRQLRQALAIQPERANAVDSLMRVKLFGFGDVPGAEALLDRPPDWRIASVASIGGDVFHLVNTRVYPAFFARRFGDALRAWEDAPAQTDSERRTVRVARAAIRVIAGDAKAAQAECKALEPELQRELGRAPDSLARLQEMSWVQVCLGQGAAALATAQRAVDVLPIGKDSYFGAYQLVGVAQIAAWAGAPERAVEVIRQLLAMPAGAVMSIPRLELDPVWDPLRSDPRFKALLEGDANTVGKHE